MILELHSCGDLTPAMIEAGVDTWAPQRSANDTRTIFEKYGSDITIGISCPLEQNAPEEEFVAWAEQFVDECVGRQGLRPPVLFDLRAPESFQQKVYALRRKKLCGEE